MKTANRDPFTDLVAEAQPFANLMVRDRDPENLEFPFSTLNSFAIAEKLPRIDINKPIDWSAI